MYYVISEAIFKAIQINLTGAPKVFGYNFKNRKRAKR